MSSSGSGANLEKYFIPLEEINRATGNFSPQRFIGSGGFGRVYRGQLSDRWENRIAAIKRLDKDSFQGEREFRNELEMISRFRHENIIAFIGYCDENTEMIIVYEYAVNGSLDYHLGDPEKKRQLTWIRRLKFCRGAARGLDYLHSGLGEDNRVIHRDMKSANILLDENFIAKVCDFGLSKLGPRNQPDTYVYTKVAGTHFYLDPTYHESSILRKESDVYSFGVVLFEMLSGILVYRKQSIGNEKEPQSLISLVRRYYYNNSIDMLIDPDIKDQTDRRSFEVFKEIAYKCISFNIQERPKMCFVIEKIEEALDIELQKNDAALVECVMEEMKFSCGKPVAAFTIYTCLLQQKYLEAESTTSFDRLIQFFNAAIEVQNKNNHMAYWLSNASTLLFLIQNNIKPDGASSVGKIPPPTSTSSTSGFCLSLLFSEAEVAKKPALVFIHQLTQYVEKVCDIIFINLKKEVELILALCIRALSTGKLRGRSSYRQDIVDRLNTLLNIFKENFVPDIIAQKIFIQFFSYINVQLFNSLLQYRRCCSTANGIELRDGLLDFGTWCRKATKKYAGTALDELQHIDQATRFLIVPEKSAISYTHIRKLCPILSKPQLNHLCKNVSDGYTMNIIADEMKHTLARLKREMEAEQFNASKDTVLLAESSRILFSFDDLSNSLQVEDFTNVKSDHVQLSKYGAFNFLYT